MGTIDDWHWERDPGGVARFTPAGDLDYDVLPDLELALHDVPGGPTAVIDIDLRFVTFLDASSARLLACYRSAARREGREVRIVNAAGMPRKVLIVLGMLPPDEPAVICLSRPRRRHAPDLAALSVDVIAMARSTIARAREVRFEVERMREARRRHERG